MDFACVFVCMFAYVCHVYKIKIHSEGLEASFFFHLFQSKKKFFPPNCHVSDT